jgi:hypothetical protein
MFFNRRLSASSWQTREPCLSESRKGHWDLRVVLYTTSPPKSPLDPRSRARSNEKLFEGGLPKLNSSFPSGVRPLPPD